MFHRNCNSNSKRELYTLSRQEVKEKSLLKKYFCILKIFLKKIEIFFSLN